jgi:branched-chain amino acid transport system permease protein
MATLAAAVAIEELVFKWQWLTGGVEGANAPAMTLPWFGGDIDLGIAGVGDAYPRRPFGVLVVVAAALCAWAVLLVRRRSIGRRWLAVRANERAVRALGVDVASAKLSAFALSAALAGVAGTLLASQRQIVSASSFAVLGSLVALALAYLGGLGTPYGAIVAGALTSGGALTAVLDSLSERDPAPTQLAVTGLALVVATISLPDGLCGRRRQRPEDRLRGVAGL